MYGKVNLVLIIAVS